jgi:hypothetical protein
VTGFLTGRQAELSETFKCDFLAIVGTFAEGMRRDPLELVVCPHTCAEALRIYLAGEFPITKIKIKRISDARAEEMQGAIYIIGNEESDQRFSVQLT